jgi:FkbM family methyltransferase
MTVALTHFTTKPHYVFHPTRAIRRALYGLNGATDAPECQIAQLPWGLPLEVYRDDAIGFSILVGGVFDPCVTETMHRLIDAGDLVVDVGANLGYLTSLGAARSGEGGRVIAFEPHPTVFELLTKNVARWHGRPGIATIETLQLALSDENGKGQLVSGPMFNRNMALASLKSPGEPNENGDAVGVSVARLDDVVSRGPIGLLKIDVEGFEAQVLRGCEKLLSGGDVRDIIFEDHNDYPSAATEVVESAGYELISLDNNLLGLRLRSPTDRGPLPPWPGPSYLATREPGRARQRLRSRGWLINGIGPSFPRLRRSHLGA